MILILDINNKLIDIVFHLMNEFIHNDVITFTKHELFFCKF